MTYRRFSDFHETIKVDGFTRSPKQHLPVIPVEAGIKSFQTVMGSGPHESDDWDAFGEFILGVTMSSDFMEN